MELCLNPHLIKKWKKLTKREVKEAKKAGRPFEPSTMLEVKFLKNLIEEFLEVLIATITKHLLLNNSMTIFVFSLEELYLCCYGICQILDSKVMPQRQIDNENQQKTIDAEKDHFNNPCNDQIDDSCVLYCERFMEFLIDLLSQLPTRRYLKFAAFSYFSG